MRKIVIALATLGVAGAIQAAPEPWSGEFCMFDPTGAPVSDITWGTTCDQLVTGDIDTAAGTFGVSSPQAFFGLPWTAHDGVTFGPGTYSIDTIQGGVYTGVVVGPGQLGGHILFNWGATADIDVVMVWDVTDNGDGTFTYTSTDGVAITPPNPDGTPGYGMLDGAFPNFSANFNMGGTPTLECKDVFVVTNTDTAVDIDIATELLGTCINADGVVTLDSYTQPVNGIVTDDGTKLTYSPSSGYGGQDTFTYTAKDDVLTATAGIEVQVGGELQGNFSMLDPNGTVFGGTNDIVFTWDGSSTNTDASDTNFGLMTIVSEKPQPFNGYIWTAHNIRVFGPGSYSFNTNCSVAELESTGCPATPSTPPGDVLSMTVGAGQYGAHILFDWSTSTNIDVVNVWDQNKPWDRLGHTGDINKLFLGPAGLPPAEDANWKLVSTDVNGDSINGSPMIDGPFAGFYANFNNQPDKAGVETPPYVHTQQDTKLGGSLLASMNIIGLFTGLMLLIGLRRTSKAK